MAKLKIKKGTIEQSNPAATMKEPVRLLVLSYIYAAVLLAAAGLLYLGNMNIIGRNAVPPFVVSDSSALVQEIKLQKAMVIPPVDIMKAAVPTSGSISKGRELYEANCSSCHGSEGNGNGPSAAMMEIKPRNFHSKTDWKNGSKISQMYKTLQEGLTAGGMPSFAYIPPADLFSVIHYVRTFLTDAPKDSPGELKQTDVIYDISKGKKVPGQIPVRKAISILEKEAGPLIAETTSLSEKIKISESEGALILKKTMLNENRALTSIVRIIKQKRNARDFIRIISAEPQMYGFRPEITRMSGEEWKALYKYISLAGKGR